MRQKKSNDALYLIVVCAIALALRLDFLIASNFVIDSDEAIVGLMAKHILDGREIPTFFYGQHYMGSLEAIVAALFFKLFGISSMWLKAVPLMFSIALIPLTFWLGRSLFGSFAGRVAALLIAIPPSPLVIWSSMARGGFIEIVCISTLALLLAIKWLNQQSLKLTIIIGLILGLGWWINNQIIYAMLPIGFCMFGRIWNQGAYPIGPLLVHGVSGVVAFLIGGAPFWIYNLNNDWRSFGIFGAAAAGSIWSHVSGLFSTSLPMLLGGKLFWHEEDLFPSSTLIVQLLYGSLLVVLVLSRRKQIFELLRLKIDKRQPAEILLLFLLTAFAAFSFSSFGHLVSAPRYLLPIYPIIFVLLGYFVGRLAELQKSFAFAAIGLLVMLHLFSCYPGKRALPGQPFVADGQRASTSHDELINWLKIKGTKVVETNYWIGYRLAFESVEQVIFGIFREPREARIVEYQDKFKSTPIEQVPLILVPAQAERVRLALSSAGMRWQEQVLSEYVVIFGREFVETNLELLPAQNFQVQTNMKAVEAPKAADGDLSTRWGSGEPQHPGMQVVVALNAPATLRAMQYEIGHWKSDVPRGLVVDLELADGTVERVVNEEQVKAQEYYAELDPVLHLQLPNKPLSKIILTQTGADPVFDWSIAELELYK